MATTNINVQFDGVTDANRLSGQNPVTWDIDNSFMGYYSVYESAANTNLVANVTLSGSNWTVAAMRFGSTLPNTVIINDADASAGRRIDYLKIGHNSVVNLQSTQVDFIDGYDGAKHDITLGSQFTHSVNLGADLNIVRTGSGYVENLNIYNGRSNIVAQGGVGRIQTDSTNDRIVVDGGNVLAVSTSSGDDTIIARNGGRIHFIEAFTGDKTMTIEAGSRIDNIRAGGGDVNLTFMGDGRAESITIFEGSLTMQTADRWIRSIQGSEVTSDIKIGPGGVGQIKFDSSLEQKHKIVANGSIGSLDLTDSSSNPDGNQSSNLVLNGYVDKASLGNGRDVVKTGGEFVRFLNTNDGNDTIIMGKGAIGFVRTGDGNDKLIVNEVPSDYGIVVQMGNGTDTIDFKKFKSGVTFDLNESGKFQNVSPPGNDPEEPGKGYFSESGVENIAGTGKGDTLIGDSSANKLIGRGGNDVLKGGGGNDLLIGGLGRDDFVFGPGGGKDTVKGFQDGLDMLQIEGHTGGFATLTRSAIKGGFHVEYDGGSLDILGGGGDGFRLTAADFEFI